jgi:hypothetical protein
VTVRWTTAAEWDHAGYNVYRTATNQFDRNVAINEQIVLSQGIQGQGASYQLNDTNVTSGAWYYWLEDIDI